MRTPRKIEGKKFGKLTTISIAYNKNGTYWNCKCECGNEAIVYVGKLTTGYTRSCGCLVGTSGTHKQSKTTEYRIWTNMKTRCYNPNNRWFHRYGGRGIVMCDRWLQSFENFLTDMGPRPSRAHTIERLNNDGNYEPSNCKWATFNEQAVNRSNTRTVMINGVRMNIRDAANALGIKYHTYYCRLRREQKGML